ncbi:predicted protein [Aspergillus nidulans FGSC A4]|uniref:Uncharacterized protein n=1 Tax=Emericella nidulans (strain FGSC A4 / ATCC 38163 / CBS 112.46 / NRRL 194 / M139) TaxID=227321 RepID=Q5B9X6_EMENI|nr:hypothetical protein [Aspergillus nidulans FGSC A4]EAA63056.1 predicted protein [Aspergillus nidulans FGSC A4]CBF84270.1 TPA: hypothetical protein ANIA_02654 [Aspergillus nidulans FGSC A4]|eukprot:XP_660258.1 predicted protein [Aspergillus nidulans FGSC A4]
MTERKEPEVSKRTKLALKGLRLVSHRDNSGTGDTRHNCTVNAISLINCFRLALSSNGEFLRVNEREEHPLNTAIYWAALQLHDSVETAQSRVFTIIEVVSRQPRDQQDIITLLKHLSVVFGAGLVFHRGLFWWKKEEVDLCAIEGWGWHQQHIWPIRSAVHYVNTFRNFRDSQKDVFGLPCLEKSRISLPLIALYSIEKSSKIQERMSYKVIQRTIRGLKNSACKPRGVV